MYIAVNVHRRPYSTGLCRVGHSGRGTPGCLDHRQGDLNNLQVVPLRQFVVRVEAKFADDIGGKGAIDQVVRVDCRPAGRFLAGGKRPVDVEPIAYLTDHSGVVAAMYLDVHTGDVGQGLVVAVRLRVEDQGFAPLLAGRAVHAQTKIGAEFQRHV